MRERVEERERWVERGMETVEERERWVEIETIREEDNHWGTRGER